MNKKNELLKANTINKNSNNKKNNPQKNNNSSSNSKIIALLIGILLISLIIGVTIISLFQKDSVSSYFIKESSTSTESIYTTVLELSEENYPDTPLDVVSLYTETYKLLYGNRIKPEYIDKLLPTILEKQRILLSNQLLNDNPIDIQMTIVKENIKFLSDNNLKVTIIECSNPIYSQENSNMAYVNVTMQDNSMSSGENGKYYYKYYLERDKNQKWHITGFYATDKEFNLLS